MRVFRRFLPLIAALFAALSAAGCASSSLGTVFSGDNSDTPRTPVTFAPIIGAPGEISGELSGHLAAEARKQNIPVVDGDGERAQYTIRGYLAASQEPDGNKLAYIWDVTDPSGQRVHRILGEETAPAGEGDAWSAFDQEALQKIAAETAGDLASWLPEQGTAATARPAAGTTEETPQQQASPPRAADETRTASISPDEVVAHVSPVENAPGDGETSLTRALRKQLSGKGVELAGSPSDGVYTVRGSVNLGAPSGGQQDIEIDWRVIDPEGQRLGTVSQANKVPEGALDGEWGPIAEAAASAAADGIIELLPDR